MTGDGVEATMEDLQGRRGRIFLKVLDILAIDGTGLFIQAQVLGRGMPTMGHPPLTCDIDSIIEVHIFQDMDSCSANDKKAQACSLRLYEPEGGFYPDWWSPPVADSSPGPGLPRGHGREPAGGPMQSIGALRERLGFGAAPSAITGHRDEGGYAESDRTPLFPPLPPFPLAVETPPWQQGPGHSTEEVLGLRES